MDALYEWFNNLITEIISLGVLAVLILVIVGPLLLIGRAIGLWKWGR